MPSTPKKRPKSKHNSYSKNSSLNSILEPPQSLFPSKGEFLRLINVLAIASAVALSCNYFLTFFTSTSKPFCDSNLDPIDSFSENDIWNDLDRHNLMQNVGSDIPHMLQEFKCPVALAEHYKTLTCRFRELVSQQSIFIMPICAGLIGCAVLFLKVRQRMYISARAEELYNQALHHLRQISQEISQPNVTVWGRRPAALRALSHKLSKGFNEAVNGFTDEGWSMLQNDDVDDVTLLVNSSLGKMMDINFSYSNGFPSMGNAVLCAKASMLLQNVPPAILLRFLQKHRSEWADSGIDAYSAAIKAEPCSLPVPRGGSFGGQVIFP
uniref:START domain-containing protein n=1 Tax=Gossypium raimondii TaxID=29730 RepID=A0A0D2SU57_GOSRA|nr:hypothetical protein B456_007G312600 [Gossypium raimondii]